MFKQINLFILVNSVNNLKIIMTKIQSTDINLSDVIILQLTKFRLIKINKFDTTHMVTLYKSIFTCNLVHS